jgi:hypothetical protein
MVKEYLEVVGRYDKKVVREEWPAVIGTLHQLYQYHVGMGGSGTIRSA